MKITNNANLPQAFVNFVSNVRHNGDKTISATTLLQGDKQIVLTDRHFDEIEEDAADMVWASFGSAFHLLMEKQNDNTFKEEAFEVSIADWKVTGRVDSYDLENEILVDWKTASVWKVIYSDFEDWRKQGLVYAWLMKQNGLNVKKCRFVALLKDHSKTDAKRKPDYPQKPIYVYEFDVTEEAMKETENFIKNKVLSVSQAYEKSDDEIMPCSSEERWETLTRWAVMKEGRKTAIRVFENREDAELLLKSLNGGHFLEERKGESKKCLDYCPCCEFCNFYKEMQKKELETFVRMD